MAGLVTLALAASVSGCSQKSPSSTTATPSAGHSLVVFAAGPLKPAFTLLSGKFQNDNPGATIDFNFATSSELANKLSQGASADVFAAADSA